METQRIWDFYNEELFFFILKKVKDKNTANDIFQATFLKIHKNKHQIKDIEKVRAWTFQIARNEINNYFHQESKYVENFDKEIETPDLPFQKICCFDKFIADLPENYRETIELVYIDGKKQKEAAEQLNISLANVKIRIKRAKEILKKRFNECCKFEFDKNGKLIGESKCSVCD